MQSQTPLVAKIVQAGAGTGKTEYLALEIVRVADVLYKKTGRLPRLVATTFTERATAELRERVVQISQRDEFVNLDWLQEYVKDTEKLQISTIHGVFAKILYRYGTLLGLDPEFTVMSEEEESKLFKKILRKILKEDDSASFLTDQYGLDNLVALQKKLEGSHKPLIDWEEILRPQLLDFYNSVKSVVDNVPQGLTPAVQKTVDTILSLYPLISIDPLKFAETREVLLKFLDGVRQPSIKEKGIEIKEDLLKIFNYYKEWREESYDPYINNKHKEVALHFFKLSSLLNRQVDEEKKEKGVLSFSDLERHTQNLLSEFSKVKDSVSSFYDFWFIDEYQDTSPLQQGILYSFFKNPWNVCFVGDPQQSIYLFRGADVRVFEETKKDVLSQGGSLEVLDTNYRSEPDLLKFMNMLFSPLKAKGEENSQSLADVYLHSKVVEEPELALDKIIKWKKEGFDFHDICILVRTNKQAKTFAKYLNQKQIPVYVHASGHFFEKREITDALFLLSFLCDPTDDMAFYTIARSPWMSLGDDFLVKLGQNMKASKTNAWSWIKEHHQDLLQTHFALKIIDKAFQMFKKWPLSFIFETLIENLGFYEMSTVADISGACEANLRKFISRLRRAETQPGFAINDFLEKAWYQTENKSDEEVAASFIEPKRVNIMTIHKSKGLKFNCVIVPGCGDGFITKHQSLEISPQGPWAMQVLSDEKEEKISPLNLIFLKNERGVRESLEHQRVFYVAVTRAAQRLCLLSSSPWSEKSWIAKINISLEEGEHNHCYNVYNFNEPLHLDSWVEKNEPFIFTDALAEKIKMKISEPPHIIDVFEPEVNLSAILKNQIFGTALHSIFEDLRLFPEQSLDQVLGRVEKKFNLKGVFDITMLKQTLQLTTPPIKAILASGHSEWAFSFLINQKIYSGRIDIWGESDGITWIIDYKSAGQMTPKLEKKVTEQLEFYALALFKKGISWEKIRAGALLPNSNSFYEVNLREPKDIMAGLNSRYLDRLVQDRSEALS